jgi:hypothetical protein
MHEHALVSGFLRISGKTSNPSEITSELGVEPTQIRVEGRPHFPLGHIAGSPPIQTSSYADDGSHTCPQLDPVGVNRPLVVTII